MSRHRFSELGGRTAYEVLGLPGSAGSADIVRAYRRRQREVHPDLGGDRDESVRVSVAYRWLTQERPEYDEYLRGRPGPEDAAREQAQEWRRRQRSRFEESGGDGRDLWAEALARAAAWNRDPRPHRSFRGRKPREWGRRRWSGKAAVALVLALAGVVVLSVPLALWALFDFRRHPERFQGRWPAVAALAVSALSLSGYGDGVLGYLS